MLFIKPALLLLALHFGTAMASTLPHVQNKLWQQHVVPNYSVFYGATLPTIDSRKVQEDIFQVLYCNDVPGFWINPRLVILCRKFPNKRMSNPNLQTVDVFNNRQSLLFDFWRNFTQNFKRFYIDGEFVNGLSDDVKRYHGELDKLVSPQPGACYFNLLLPRFVLPKIATEDHIKNGISVKPHLVRVSDYLNKGIKDTIYDEHPLKEVMDAIKRVKDKSKIDKFADAADDLLRQIAPAAVNIDILENLPGLILKMTNFEQDLVVMAKDYLDPVAKDEVIRKFQKLEIEKLENEVLETLSRKGEGPGSILELYKSSKQEGEEKRKELEAKVAQLVAENGTIKAQLAASNLPDLAKKYHEVTTEIQTMKAQLAEKDALSQKYHEETTKIRNLLELFKNAKQDGEQKRKELEAKVAQLVAENDKIKAQLAASSLSDLAQKYHEATTEIQTMKAQLADKNALSQKYQEATTEVEKMKAELAKKDTEAASRYQEAMKDIQKLNSEIKELKEQQLKREIESSKKYQEAEAEIKRVKTLLAEREAEVSSSKQAQIYAENVARIAKGKEDKLQKEVKKLEELLKKKESEPPVVVFTPPPPTKSVDLGELFVYGFFALIVIFFLVSFIASICRRQRRDIV